ncbi:MAG TPA: DNA methyltransferase [Gemmatimonadaceae bacterium]|nr:DNA methyltransferase [Gemmatimonadaceae bacterium]
MLPALATELLSRAETPARLVTLASELGFTERPERLTAELRAELRLPGEAASARLIRGTGALRALVVELAPGAAPRESLTRIAVSLSTTAPHCIWLVLGCSAARATVFLGAWLTRPAHCSVRALVVDRHHVYASDAETLCALKAARAGPDVLIHSRWLEILGRDALTGRFHTALSGAIRSLADELPKTVAPTARAEMALLNVSRLVFLAFLQTKGWLDGDAGFLQNAYAAGIAGGGRVHATVLEPLFFGTLNTRVRHREPRARAFGRIPYLNGGLFGRTHVERLHRSARFPDDAIGRVFDEVLSRYRFTPEEEPADWSEAAIDPVILGRAFESLMDGRARRATGVFYTPAPVVERATRLALEHALSGQGIARSEIVGALDGGVVCPATAIQLMDRLRGLRVLDPACGSGAFLVHALRIIADMRVQLGGEARMDARYAVLTNSIFGVDVNPTAVWLCELRLWLCLAVECAVSDPLSVPPLPNLDRNIRVGDSLAGSACTGAGEWMLAPVEVAVLRSRYARAQGPRKRTLGRALDAVERKAAVAACESRLRKLAASRRELLIVARSRDLFGTRRAGARESIELRQLRQAVRAARDDRRRLSSGGALAFSFPVQFADAAQAGGFDLVLGNPPWVRPHRLSSAARAALRNAFRVCRPRATTETRVGTRPSFGAQVDLAAPFVERSLELLRPAGVLALLLPTKLWSSLAGAALREHVTSRGMLHVIEDFTAAPQMFDAATYPSLLVAGRAVADPDSQRQGTARVVVHRRDTQIEWQVEPASLILDDRPGSPWLLVPPQVRRAFDVVSCAGTPLAQTSFGAPRLGVKTGCNRAFVVSVTDWGPSLAAVRQDDQRGWVERSLLRPALRGELVRPWRVPRPSAEYLIWTHDAGVRPLARLPRHAGNWLRRWRAVLSERADARGGDVWWQLFRTPAADCHRHRVVWCDIGRAPRALVLEPGDPTVPINTCYVAFADEAGAWALAALLNCDLAAAWLNVVAEPARGGYRRYFAWTMAALPIPRDEQAFRDELAPLGRAAGRGEQLLQQELLDAALAAYQLRHRDVAPLLEWRDV